ncbi:MAG: universal stress protein [Thermoleophilaceae bacterium]|nr:universal stress protein [Thermoleophilaceae bacterium]
MAGSEHGVAIGGGARRSAIRGQVLAGGVAQQLLRGSRLPVAVAPMGFAAEEPSDLRVLAVAYNGSAESELALKVAAEMALRVGATLRVLAVDEPLRGAGFAAVATGYVESTREWLRQRLEEATGALPSSLRAQAVLLDGEAAAAIAAQAELGVDLLVTGSRAHGALGRVLLGSTSSKLMRTAPCPVLAVPRPAEPRGASAGGGFAPASARPA